MNYMKQYKISHLVLAFLLFAANKTYSETTNQLGRLAFGDQLSISLSNNVIAAGSKALLQCLTKNFSTNVVCFIQTESRGMYEVILIDDSGKSIEINNPANVGDSSERMGGVRSGESFECPVLLLFDDKIKPGHYKVIAKQRVYIFRKPDRQDIQRGELTSNLLEIEVK